MNSKKNVVKIQHLCFFKQNSLIFIKIYCKNDKKTPFIINNNIKQRSN